MDINFAVPCLLGLEAPIAEELRNMEASDVRAENGRVLFSGDENILARANICSRFSERVLVLLGSFEAHSFEELFQGTRALPWEQWIGADDAFPVKGRKPPEVSLPTVLCMMIGGSKNDRHIIAA